MSNGAYARILCSYIPILHLLDTIDHYNPNAITFQPLSIIPVHPHLLLGEPFKCCSNNKNNNNTRTAPSTDFLFILQERRQSSYLQIFQENLFISSINPSIHIRFTSFWPDKQTDRQTDSWHSFNADWFRKSIEMTFCSCPRLCTVPVVSNRSAIIFNRSSALQTMRFEEDTYICMYYTHTQKATNILKCVSSTVMWLNSPTCSYRLF